jgi:hypothetical protein
MDSMADKRMYRDIPFLFQIRTHIPFLSSYSVAAYALMNGIDTSGNCLMQKKLNDTWMQIQMVNLVSARQKDALNALMRLQSYGVKDNI